MAHLLDSSIWVALFLDFDIHHKRAGEVFENIRGTVYVPYCVANEVATILAYKHSKKQADSFLEFIENTSGIFLFDNSFEEESSFYRSVQAKISFTDAALLFLTKKMEAKLLTFDKQLKRLNKRAAKNGL